MKFSSKAMIALSVALPLISTMSVQANPFKKHPIMAGVGAGMMAHHMAKHSAKHGHHGMMARHPGMTGLGAGMAMHHMMKKH